MLVDLNLRGRRAVVAGAGGEAEKRVSGLLGQGCEILVIGEGPGPRLEGLARDGRIGLEERRITGVRFVAELRPDVVIAATDDGPLNARIMAAARRRGAIAYSSDDPEGSDYANASVIDFAGAVQVAVYTGGQSPAMSRRLAAMCRDALRGVITPREIGHIRVQREARGLARRAIPSQRRRRQYLRSVLDDAEIDRLVRAGQLGRAKRHAARMLGDWK